MRMINVPDLTGETSVAGLAEKLQPFLNEVAALVSPDVSAPAPVAASTTENPVAPADTAPVAAPEAAPASDTPAA